VETAQHEAERLDGHILAREGAAELNVRQFMKRDPGPEGRIRVHGITALQYYGSELTCGDAHGKVKGEKVKKQLLLLTWHAQFNDVVWRECALGCILRFLFFPCFR